MNYKIFEKPDFYFAGISCRTENADGKAGQDIYNLWDRLFKEDISRKISNKISDDTYTVYTDYESDHNGEYTAIVGFPVTYTKEAPKGIELFKIKGGKYAEIIARGELPDCVLEAWEDIYNSDLDRRYGADFDIYPDDNLDPLNTKVKIYVSIK